MADNLEFLSVLNGIISGINSGLEKRREYSVQDKKIEAEKQQSELYSQKQVNEERRLNLMEEKVFGEQAISKQKVGIDAAEAGMKAKSMTDEAINRINDNRQKAMDKQTDLLPYITRTEAQLEGLDPEKDADIYGGLKQKLDTYRNQYNRYEDSIKGFDNQLYERSNKKMGVPKPQGKLAPQKGIGGPSVGALKPAEQSHINEAKRLASDPNVGDADIRRFAAGISIDDMSQEGREELREALRQAILSKKAR